MMSIYHCQLYQITALYYTMVLLIQYPTHYRVPVPLRENIVIIHCLFHGWKHIYKSQITLAGKIRSGGGNLFLLA